MALAPACNPIVPLPASLTTLAVGIGSRTALFTLVDAVLLRPLPCKEPHCLIEIGAHW